MKPKFALRAALFASLSITSSPLHGANGTWLGTSGNWSATGTWSGGTVADGTGFTANFTGVNITANQTITLDTARTIGNITFTDATTSSNNLTISGANTLTLDVTSGAPVINVTQSDRTLTIGSVIAGNDGMQKSGTGTLSLTAANTYTGITNISAGTLSLGHVNALQNTTGITIGGASAATLSTSIDNISIGVPITLANSGVNSTIAFGRDSGATGTLNLNGAIGGNGNLIITTPNISSANNLQTVVLGAASTYAGSTTITTGNINNTNTIKNGVANALPTTTVLNIDGGNGTASSTRTTTYDLNGYNQTLAGLTNNTTRTTRAQRVTNSGSLATLTINNTADYSYGSTVVGATTTTAIITGALNLVKDGSGTQTLTGAANSFTGTTTVLGGILSLGHSGSLQSSAYDTGASITGDATNGLRTTVTTLTLGGLIGSKNFADVFTTTSGGYNAVTSLTLSPGSGVTRSYSGILSDGAAGMTLTKSGAGTQALAGANTYTGVTNHNGGVLAVSHGDVLGSTAAGTVITVTGTTGASSGQLTLSGGINVAENFSFSGTTEAGSFNAAIRSDSGNNTLSGIIDLSGASGSIRIGTAPGNNDTFTIDGTITQTSTTNGLVLQHQSGSQIFVNNAMTLNGATIKVSASSGVTGFVQLNAANGSGIGETNILSRGVLKAGANNILNTSARLLIGLDASNSGNSLGQDNGSVDLNGYNLMVGALEGYANATSNASGNSSRFITNSAASGTALLTVGNGGASGTFNGEINDGATASIALTKAGNGTQILSGANSYTGLTTINAGALRITDASGLGGTAQGTAVNGSSGGTTVARLELSGGITVTGEAVTIKGGGNFVGALTSFSGVNEWAGNVTVDAASTRIGASPGATLKVSGVIDSGVNSYGLTIRTGDVNSPVVLSGANTYLGDTTISLGKLQLDGGNNRLPVATKLIMGNAANFAEFDLNGRSQEVAGLAITSGATSANNSIKNASATLSTLTVNTAAASPSSFGGILNGNLALTKTGSDALTLSATNSYTGATTVSGGTLIINGNISTSILTTVESGATLGGSGTVGALTINAGGSFSPGNSPGIMTVDGDYIQNGQLNVEIEGLTAGNGSGFHDRVDVTGTVTLNGVLNLAPFTGFTPVNGDLIFILLNDDTDAISGTFTGLAQGAVVGNYLGFDWQISYAANSSGTSFSGGNDVALMAVAVPEPRAALLGSLGLLMLMRRRR